MGIEDDINYIKHKISLDYELMARIEAKLDKLLEHQKEAKLWEEKGKDKAIKDSLKEPEVIPCIHGRVRNCKICKPTEMGCKAHDD